MKKHAILFGISLVAVLVILTGLYPSVPTGAVELTPTTSLHIIKLGPDGTTVLHETTVSYSTLEATLPVQGDGVTHYWTQSITSDTANPWDPAEQINLKDKGALKGTDLKDLCDLVGGMSPGDIVKLKASDNYGNDPYPYANVYTPDPKQGKMVVCWYNSAPEEGSAGYVPTWSDGMLLAFFASVPNQDGKLVFGNQDMHDYLPQGIWHYNSGYPSADGLYVKCVQDITIYTNPTPAWSLALSGARTDTISEAEFENAQSTSSHGVTTYTDASGVWSGIPLWMLIAYVDDTSIIHGEGSYNDILAQAGYNVKVIGTGSSCTFNSKDIARSSTYLLANQVNGRSLPVNSYPLKLVGSGLSSSEQSIGQIYKIELSAIPTIAQWNLQLEGAIQHTIPQNLAQDCTRCHGDAAQTWTSGSNTWSGVPLWRYVGWVDDDNVHNITGSGPSSYNDELAAEGYGIKITGTDGTETVLNSRDITRSNHYLLANKLNGQYLTGDQYPLALVGSGVPSSQQVMGVSKVQLVFSNPWDLNGDHVCNIGDFVDIGQHWGARGLPGWIPEDLNDDGVIDIGDVVLLGRHWGETW